MSGSSLTETDPTLQVYEAQAIIVEKDQKLEEKDFEIERLKQEIEMLRMENNSNKNQQELAQKVEKLERDLASQIENLSDRLKNLELVANQNKNIKKLSQKIIKIEQDLAASQNKNFDLINHLTSLERSVNQLNEKNKLGSQQNLMPDAQNAVQIENKVEIESGGQQKTSVLILGGRGFLNTIYLLDSKAQSWKKLKITLPMGLFDFGAVAHNEEIYIFGGNSKDCYKLRDDGSWIKLASLNQKRVYISSSSLVYKGDIWVIGGYSGDSGKPLKSVEKYDISQDKWTYMPEMNYARRYAAAAVFKDRIFVTGGWSEEYLKSVEMFDPKLQEWIFFCDLPIEVACHTMLISNSTLSIFGGYSRSSNSVWEMAIEDPKKKWTEKLSFKHSRCEFGIGKLSNGIIVFGGWGESGETSEIFDGKKWIEGPILPQDLAHFAYTSIPRSLEGRFLKKFFRQEQPRNQQNLMPDGVLKSDLFKGVLAQNTSVLILGGFQDLNTIYLLDSKTQSWKKLSITLPMGLFDFGAVVLNEEIYIFGGYGNGIQQDCYKLKDDGSWAKLASLNQKRSNISSSSLVYKGDIWVIGGSDGEKLKSVEKYNVSQNKWIFFSQDKWTFMPEMNYARQDAAAAVFKDRIFVTGGWNKTFFKSVEVFDLKLQKWILFCDLPIGVSCHTILISNSTLSIFGGRSESDRLNSVWEIDIENPAKKWTEKQSFKRPRSFFGIGKLSNGIIVFGNSENNGETSEIFDGNEWIDGPKLPQALSHFAYTSIPRSLEERFLTKFS